jgi:hypothetical protein
MGRIKLFLLYMLGVFALVISGAYLISKPDVQAYLKVTERTATMYDAYERYYDNGKPGWIGLFRDNKTGTRFEWNLEPNQYREFIATNKPKEYVVKASLDKIDAPGAPFGSGFGPFLFFMAMLVFCWGSIHTLFHEPDRYY